MAACEAAPSGSVAALEGLEAVQLCLPGTFAPSIGGTACQLCPAGSFSSGNGSTGCALCEAGTFSDRLGATACRPCSSGSAATFAGATACSLCRPGTHAAAPGASECVPCERGTASPGSGSASCTPCPAGWMGPAVGSTECERCEPGSFASAERSTACRLCPVGSFAGLRAAVSCTSCPQGTGTASPGATSLAACEAGRTQCAAGTAEDPSTGLCVPLVCDAGLIDAGGGCVGCGAGEWGTPGPGGCVPCSPDEVCPGGLPRPLRRGDASSAAVVIPHAELAATLGPAQGSDAELWRSLRASWFLLGVVVLVGIAALAIVLAVMLPPSRRCFRALDSFSLKHFVPKGASVVRRTTVVGGLVTVVMGLAVLAFAADSALSFVAENEVASTTLVLSNKAPIERVHGATAAQAALVAVPGSALEPFRAASCPAAASVWSLPPGWAAADAPAREGACAYRARCASCRFATGARLVATLPWGFQLGSWALGTGAARLATDPAVAPSVVEGGWGNGSAGLIGDVEVTVSSTAEARVRGGDVGHGYVLTLESVTETPSGADPPRGFVPVSVPVKVALVLRPVPNALVTELTPRLTAVQAASLLVGALGGITSAFAVLVAACEAASVRLVAATGSDSVNFAEADVPEPRSRAPRRLSMKPVLSKPGLLESASESVSRPAVASRLAGSGTGPGGGTAAPLASMSSLGSENRFHSNPLRVKQQGH